MEQNYLKLSYNIKVKKGATMNNQKEYFEKYKDKLYQLLCYCKKEIDFYKNNWNFTLPELKDFDYEYFQKNIPILEKCKVRGSSEEFLNKNFKIEDLSIDSTSGTEGKPIICYRSKKEQVMCSNSLWRLRRRFVMSRFRGIFMK